MTALTTSRSTSVDHAAGCRPSREVFGARRAAAFPCLGSRVGRTWTAAAAISAYLTIRSVRMPTPKLEPLSWPPSVFEAYLSLGWDGLHFLGKGNGTPIQNDKF